MKAIKLTKGQVALVDDEDFERVNAFKWQAHWAEKTNSYYATSFIHQRGSRLQKHISMSRLVMNTPKGLICDHINHDTLDNRKSNLRNCTVKQNNMNTKVRRDNILGIKNIRKVKNQYSVRLQINGKTVLNKTFQTLKDAISARDNLSKLLHKDFYLENKEPPD